MLDMRANHLTFQQVDFYSCKVISLSKVVSDFIFYYQISLFEGI